MFFLISLEIHYNKNILVTEVSSYFHYFKEDIPETHKLFRCQISDDICCLLFYFNKLSLGKAFICKVEGLNVKQRRSR